MKLLILVFPYVEIVRTKKQIEMEKYLLSAKKYKLDQIHAVLLYDLVTLPVYIVHGGYKLAI